MAKESSPSFFHRMNDGLTINLADVEFAEDRTKYHSSLPDDPFSAELVASGKTYCIGMRPSVSWYGMGTSGERFNVTAEEFRAVQDGLEWYNKNLATLPR